MRTLPPFGLMAEFDSPERLVDGVGKARAAGFRDLDALTPFPVEGLAEALAFADNRIPRLTLAGGLAGAALGFALQIGTNLAYPIDIGGRPLLAAPALALIAVELAILGAVLAAIGGMLVLNRLPRLHHPVFDVPSFRLCDADAFFLVVLASDDRFDRAETRRFLQSLDPVRVDLIGHAEAPE